MQTLTQADLMRLEDALLILLASGQTPDLCHEPFVALLKKLGEMIDETISEE